MIKNFIIILSILSLNLSGQVKLPDFYPKEVQQTIDSLKKRGVTKLAAYYRDNRKDGVELVDRKTFEPVNHIYVYLLWRDSLQKGLTVIKFKDKHGFTGWMFCRSFVDIFDNYTKTEITNKNLVKPPHINEGDTYQFSNITLYDSCGMSSFDFVNEVNKTEALSGLQFYL